MKKSTVIIIFLLLAILKTQAQDYLISFAGSGVTNVVGTVKVDNLTSGATVTLNGEDVLHLIPAVGIGTLDNNNETLHIYPNPMAEQAMLTFVASESGNVVIGIFDLSAKTVCQFSSMLSTGIHSFRISGISRGMYFVKVTGINYNYSTKLISQSNLQSTARIEYVSSVKNPASNQLKNITATIDMPYTDGDQLLYTGSSGIYSTIVTDVPISSKTITFNFVACTDNDGNNYTTVQIGTGKSVAQIWMAENLNVGVRIDGYQDQSNNSIIEKYCYNDDNNNCNTYGALYQWNEAMQYSTTPGVQGICPTGWHLPSDAEWTVLTNFLHGDTTFLGGDTIITGAPGGKMKEAGTAHWLSPNTGATNSSGFTALPGGERFSYDGSFYDLTTYANFWSSTEWWSTGALGRDLSYSNERASGNISGKTYGYSVRCVHD
jgi:uncharacterized protein (TIGR02145 family)